MIKLERSTSIYSWIRSGRLEAFCPSKLKFYRSHFFLSEYQISNLIKKKLVVRNHPSLRSGKKKRPILVEIVLAIQKKKASNPSSRNGTGKKCGQRSLLATLKAGRRRSYIGRAARVKSTGSY